MPDEKSPQKSLRDPQALSGEYHKARKQLMLWAAILFIWELVGIDLEVAKTAGGNTGAIIAAIKSPQAIPWILLILVAYFTFKLRIEWRQCNKARREIKEAKQDYYSAWVFAVAAYFLYWGQAISRVQIADRLQAVGPGKIISFLGGPVTVTVSLIGFRRARNVLREKQPKFLFVMWLLYGPVVGPLISLITSRLYGSGWIWSTYFVGLAIGAAAAGFIYFIYRRWWSHRANLAQRGQ